MIRFSSLGDVVLVEPVFLVLRQQYPEDEVTFLTRIAWAPLYEGHPAVDRIWGWDPVHQSLVQLARQLRRARFDRVVDLHRSLRSRLLGWGAGAPVSSLERQGGRRGMMTLRPPFKLRSAVTPTMVRYLEAVGLSRQQAAAHAPRLQASPHLRRYGQAWVHRRRGKQVGRLIALLPGARHRTKRWPPQHMAALARLIQARGDLPVLLPAPGEQEEACRIAAIAVLMGAAPVEVVEPLAGIGELTGVLAACDGAVANDSGPMHLAAAVGIPVVGLFGPTSPELGFAPRGAHAVALHLGLSCSPCSRHGRSPCFRPLRYCLYDLTPQRVAESLYALIT